MADAEIRPELERYLSAYMAAREKRSVIKRAYEAEDAILKRVLSIIEVALMKLMKKVGSENLKIKGVGQAYMTPKTFYSGKDWDSLWKYIEESGNLALLQRRLSSTAVKEYIESNDGDLPPGVNANTEKTVVVRTA